jgi:hypothetical protein
MKATDLPRSELTRAVEEVTDIVASAGFIKVDELIAQLNRADWLKVGGRDARRRKLRLVREHANAMGIPLCGTDDGYYIARTQEDASRAARRLIAQGTTAVQHGRVLLDIAAKLPSGRLPFEN